MPAKRAKLTIASAESGKLQPLTSSHMRMFFLTARVNILRTLKLAIQLDEILSFSVSAREFASC